MSVGKHQNVTDFLYILYNLYFSNNRAHFFLPQAANENSLTDSQRAREKTICNYLTLNKHTAQQSTLKCEHMHALMHKYLIYLCGIKPIHPPMLAYNDA